MIQSGLENLDSGIGIYAPDAEAYSVFAPLFDPIIGRCENKTESPAYHCFTSTQRSIMEASKTAMSILPATSEILQSLGMLILR